ncbi:hypothetical protein VTO42DRAFT_1728 [Malbranchea cinnamomea]
MSHFDLTSLFALLHTWYSNFTTNVAESFAGLSVRDYIRLVWIIGGYLFLRPYLDKGFRKLMDRGHQKAEAAQAQAEREEAERRAKSDAAGAKMSGNMLRGAFVEEDDDDSESDGDGRASAVPQWGKSARRRQRKFMEWLEQEAERRRNEDDDKDIADLLED